MSDTLTIHNGKVVLKTEEGNSIERPETDLYDMFRREIRPPIDGCALPDGIKFYEWRDPFFLVVHQHPPFCRLLRWITDDSPADYGPGTKYRQVRLSMPYTITFALYFHRGGKLFLTGYNELYFRNQPLTSKRDTLCFPALLNVSAIKMPERTRSWICTQHLQNTPEMDWTTQLGNLISHTWDGAFNRSSERHEGASFYGVSQGAHPDLHPVERWQEASRQNDAFGLTVSWKPAKHTVGELMECMLDEIAKQNYYVPEALVAKPKLNGVVQRFMNFAQQKLAKV
jgi:hypothetical protein